VFHFQGFTDVQLHLVEDNSQVVQQRDKEITQIVRSIQDLNEIFRDLGSMIVEQVSLAEVRVFFAYDYSLQCHSPGNSTLA
jgi:hypothetical protein